MTCVALSISGFIARGTAVLGGARWVSNRPARVLPHVVDTTLLVSAVVLAIAIGQYPIRDAWLTAKVLGLVAYVGLGTLALRRGRTRKQKAAAFAAALLVATYIVAVAVTKSPLPWSA